MPFGNWLSIPVSRLSLRLRSRSGSARTLPSLASLMRCCCGRYLIRIPSGSFFCANDPRHWRAAQRGFTDLALFRRDRANLSGRMGEANPERIGAARVTWNFFGILGLPPTLGRDFAEADDLPGSGKVVLITHGLWQRRFGGSRDVLGQQLMI